MIGRNPYAAAGYQVLKVETHLHSLHSDGNDSVEAMFEACQSAGYDAVALTDHNTVSGLGEATEVADRLGVVLIAGVEVTTFQGHAVALGVTRVPEWRHLERRGIDELIEEVHADGGLVCIAHPAALGSPVCSGCAWDWPLLPDSFDLWEVFSAPRPATDVSLALWQQRLETGATAGPVAAGDVHSARAAAKDRTATFVYANERSAAGVLDALRQRRLFASAGQALDFWLENEHGDVALAGSRVSAGQWTPHAAESDSVQTVALARGGACMYAERRGVHGRLEAISAPIWIDTST
jgi:hypothetical protein